MIGQARPKLVLGNVRERGSRLPVAEVCWLIKLDCVIPVPHELSHSRRPRPPLRITMETRPFPRWVTPSVSLFRLPRIVELVSSLTGRRHE